MRIEMMDHHLQRQLSHEGNRPFTVHSVFTHACNFLTEEGVWVTIVSQHRRLPPNGMRIDHNRDLRTQFKQGERVFLPVKDPEIRVMKLDVTSLSMKEKETRRNQSIKLEYMKACLDEKGMPESLVKRELPGGIEGSLRLLEQSLDKNSLEAVKKAAQGLIGFGSGLTPSMDDYLTGRILMWKAWSTNFPETAEEDYSRVIEEAGRGKTTAASEWMIRFAAEGRCSEEILCFIDCFFAKSSGREFEEAFHEVLQIGSTSGEDLMLGMVKEGTRLLKKVEGGSSKWD